MGPSSSWPQAAWPYPTSILWLIIHPHPAWGLNFPVLSQGQCLGLSAPLQGSPRGSLLLLDVLLVLQTVLTAQILVFSPNLLVSGPPPGTQAWPSYFSIRTPHTVMHTTTHTWRREHKAPWSPGQEREHPEVSPDPASEFFLLPDRSPLAALRTALASPQHNPGPDLQTLHTTGENPGTHALFLVPERTHYPVLYQVQLALTFTGLCPTGSPQPAYRHNRPNTAGLSTSFGSPPPFGSSYARPVQVARELRWWTNEDTLGGAWEQGAEAQLSASHTGTCMYQCQGLGGIVLSPVSALPSACTIMPWMEPILARLTRTAPSPESHSTSSETAAQRGWRIRLPCDQRRHGKKKPSLLPRSRFPHQPRSQMCKYLTLLTY